MKTSAAPPNKLKRLQLLSAIILLALWQCAAWLMNKPLILPTPVSTFSALISLIGDPEFLSAIGATLWRGLLAFILSILAGIATGIAAGLNPTASALLKPLITVIRTTPVISVILLALIWFSNHAAPVFIGVLIMYPIITANVTEGIHATDSRLVEMAAIHGIKKIRILREIYFPSIMPFFLAGLSSAAGIGWKGIIAGEALSQPALGLGARMQHAQTYLLVAEVIAWTLTAIITGYIFESGIERIRKKTSAWR